MRYPIVFWDSGGTIFHSHDRPEGFTGCPTPGEVARQRVFRAARALEMFNHDPPPDLPEILERQQAALRQRHGAHFSLETLAAGVYDHLGLQHADEETMMLADALGGVGLVDFFGPICCSCDHGVLKPDARTFAFALSRLVPEPSGEERVLYVGDHVAKDIEGRRPSAGTRPTT